MPSLDTMARERLARAREDRLLRQLATTHRLDHAQAVRDGRTLVSFSCNDYLGLSRDPRVIAAAREAIERYGAGAGASRLITGNHPLYEPLETALAEFKHTASALVFGSGFLANLGVIPTLVGRGDLILADRLCHASMNHAARLSGAQCLRFEHNDVDHCRALLRQSRSAAGRALIMTESVFSMDGDLGRVEELQNLAREFDAWLLVDDAHGLGVCPSPRADVIVGTLSKALGSVGGYVAGSRLLIELLVQKAHTLIYTTGLPPATIAAAAKALEIVRADPGLAARPLANARRFTKALGRAAATSPIVPVIVGSAARALEASERLAEHGFLVVAIRPPTVPADSSRLRFAFSAGQTAAAIEAAAALLIQHGFA